MFKELEAINSRPELFEFYTAEELWADEHTSEKMLQNHLNSDIDVSSRNESFIDDSVKWISSHFNISEKTRIVDFGCGPGLYSTRLARLGAQVTGIDFSKRSIDYAKATAKQEGLTINYVNQNYLMYETDSTFDLIIMIMCDYCALSPVQRSSLLAKFNRMLNHDGAILLDVYSTGRFEKIEEKADYEVNQLNSFWAKEKYYGFSNTFKYMDSKVTLDKFTILTNQHSKTVYNWLQHFSPEELELEFDKFSLRVTEQYADVAGNEFLPDGDEFAIVAKKIN